MRIINPKGNYAFVKGISPYSAGVVAAHGFTIEHARLQPALPLRAGFEVVRRGETTPDALAAKARFVLGLMESRMRELGADWRDVTTTDVYTVHDIRPLMGPMILPRLGAAKQHGINWHYARPPIVSIEY